MVKHLLQSIALRPTLNITKVDSLRTSIYTLVVNFKTYFSLHIGVIMTNTSSKTKNLVICAIFVALLAICSWISIPLTVPVTMQTFAIFLCAGLLGTKRSCASIACWIILGFIGVPVFAGFQGGPAVIFGPLGGYILGFLISAVIVGIAAEKLGRKAAVLAVFMVIGLILCYAFGTVWFMYFYGKAAGPVGIGAALSMCVIPFVIPDLAKIALAVFLTKRLERFV